MPEPWAVELCGRPQGPPNQRSPSLSLRVSDLFSSVWTSRFHVAGDQGAAGSVLLPHSLADPEGGPFS